MLASVSTPNLSVSGQKRSAAIARMRRSASGVDAEAAILVSRKRLLIDPERPGELGALEAEGSTKEHEIGP
jgi:hypothetical protein